MNDDNKPAGKIEDRTKQAMSRQIPKNSSAPGGGDDMTEAMAENRKGANAKQVNEDQQTRAMSNEFDLNSKKTAGADDMTEAMTERREVVEKDSKKK